MEANKIMTFEEIKFEELELVEELDGSDFLKGFGTGVSTACAIVMLIAVFT